MLKRLILNDLQEIFFPNLILLSLGVLFNIMGQNKGISGILTMVTIFIIIIVYLGLSDVKKQIMYYLSNTNISRKEFVKSRYILALSTFIFDFAIIILMGYICSENGFLKDLKVAFDVSNDTLVFKILLGIFFISLSKMCVYLFMVQICGIKLAYVLIFLFGGLIDLLYFAYFYTYPDIVTNISLVIGILSCYLSYQGCVSNIEISDF